MPSDKSYQKLYKQLGYSFSDTTLLDQALSHSSFGPQNNERLEFLGDAILGWIIAQDLYQRFPSAQEGHLSRLRSRLVRGETLAAMAKTKKLGDFLRLGQGELKSGGFNRKSILADAMEAVIGAIYLDAGVEVCSETVLSWYAQELDALTLDDGLKDPKTRLQEFLQSRQLSLPHYEVIETSGKDHQQLFTVRCQVESLSGSYTGQGSSRRKAEQAAAKAVLGTLEEESVG